MDDAELLRLYLAERSQSAFAELVCRHLGLVYHTALRVCGGDAHRAEDVAQTVFVDLARKARELSSHTGLAGWLYTSARYAAAQAVRTEVRRQVRETEATAMNAADPAPDWEKLKPVIDEALDALSEADREAVLLRYFEGRPFAEIGRQLATSEDAARMRVDRALDKMREAMSRKGVASTAAALSAVLLGQANAAVPAGLAASVTAGALGSGVAVGAIAFMSITKLQAAVAAIVLAAGVTSLVVQHKQNSQLQTEVATLTAENKRLTETVNEIDRTRAALANAEPGIATVPTAPAPTSPVAVQSTPAPSTRPLAAGLLPVEKLGNSGVATPTAAWSTQLWAARSGDLALEASTLDFSPQDRARLEALAATLPADLRSQYDSAEKLMALALSANPHPVAGMQIVGQTQQGSDAVVLQTQWQRVDDDVVHHSDVTVRRDASGGWRVVMPTAIVDRAIAYLSRDVSGAPPRG